MQKDEIIKAPCNNCGGSTNHRVIETREKSGYIHDEHFSEETLDWTEQYTMLECCGCESICLRHDSEYSWADDVVTSYYPPRISRNLPKWFTDLPEVLQNLMREVYSALASDSPRLAAMGARTIVDMVILEKVGDVGTFAVKLRDLQDQGFIAPRHREYLEAAINAGSAAAHRGFAPPEDRLNQVMDIVENLLQAVYVLPKAADDLRRNTPPRRPPSTP